MRTVGDLMIYTVGDSSTLWKTNIEPKNGGLEDDIPFQLCDF